MKVWLKVTECGPQVEAAFFFSRSSLHNENGLLLSSWPTFITTVPASFYPCVVSLWIIQLIQQIFSTWAENWGPKVHSLFVQIQLPEPRDPVTEPDSRGFPGRPWTKARSTWLSVQRSGR